MSDIRSPTVTIADGVAMPLLGLGTWQASDQEAHDAVRTALDLGYRLIDTATMYRNEAAVGRAVRDSGFAREEVFLTTKLQASDAGREQDTIRASLDAMGLDYLDLWLIHWPVARGKGAGTWQRFIEARDAGLTRAVGVSNYSVAEIDELTGSTGELVPLNATVNSTLNAREAGTRSPDCSRLLERQSGCLDHRTLASERRAPPSRSVGQVRLRHAGEVLVGP